MVPPILEIFVVWHPDDSDGERIAGEFIDHFHGTTFSGLIGGAVEIYVRSEGWRDASDAPRPLPPAVAQPYDVAQAAVTAVVPILGDGLAAAVQLGVGPWHDYARVIAALADRPTQRVGVFPLRISKQATDGTVLREIFGPMQAIGEPSTHLGEDLVATRCRDLAQGIAQLVNDQRRLTVFVSHTKRATQGEGEAIDNLIERVRRTIAGTRLAEYFDASDLQPGVRWEDDLESSARTSALLAIRTDLYASREWCQREIATAKRAGMPVVILDALSAGEERGSFLMDHVPRAPSRSDTNEAVDDAIVGALNRLVDESLKRELWAHQREVTNNGERWGIAWWAPHAPEPLTLAGWLLANLSQLPVAGDVRVLHPDPPLGPVERDVLVEIATLAGLRDRLDVMTPRGLAARGG